MTQFQELSVEQQVDAVSRMTTAELIAVCRFYFPGAALTLPRSYLERKVAYRVQELAYGGLDAATSRKLFEAKRNLKDDLPGAFHVNRTPLVGTRLVRVCRGVKHEATVGDGYFEYAGKRFESLSAIALEITGKKTNGWTFFRLGAKSRTVAA